MIDWGKYWLRDPAAIKRILANPDIEWKGTHSINSGEVLEYPITGKWKQWDFEIKSPTWLEIEGSLHKYWNNGGNQNDFTLPALYKSVVGFSKFLHVSPYSLTIHNLEFGLNIHPTLNASEIMRDIICFKNRSPIKPIDDDRGFYIEFDTYDYYFKIYDKGKQYNTTNTLRIEIKAKNSGFLKFASIYTMADLLNVNNLKSLGRKIDNLLGKVVFDDNTINPNILSIPDNKVYQFLINPRAWIDYRKKKSTTMKSTGTKIPSNSVNLWCKKAYYYPIQIGEGKMAGVGGSFR